MAFPFLGNTIFSTGLNGMQRRASVAFDDTPIFRRDEQIFDSETDSVTSRPTIRLLDEEHYHSESDSNVNIDFSVPWWVNAALRTRENGRFLSNGSFFSARRKSWFCTNNYNRQEYRLYWESLSASSDRSTRNSQKRNMRMRDFSAFMPGLLNMSWVCQHSQFLVSARCTTVVWKKSRVKSTSSWSWRKWRLVSKNGKDWPRKRRKCEKDSQKKWPRWGATLIVFKRWRKFSNERTRDSIIRRIFPIS